jgi:NADPH:quinone reductase-like Zn-dependent oxidoreductase
LIVVTLVIQLGKLSGFSPIITTASLKHEAFLKSIGATHVIDRHLPLSSLRSEVEQITALPLKVVYDIMSSPSSDTQQAGYDLLAPGGTIILNPRAHVIPVEGKETVGVFGSWNFHHIPQRGVTLYNKLTELLEKGVLQVCHTLSKPEVPNH